MRLGQAEGGPLFAGEAAEDEFVLLFGRAEMLEHRNEGKIADDRVFILQVVVQPQPLGGEAVADHCHPQV